MLTNELQRNPRFSELGFLFLERLPKPRAKEIKTLVIVSAVLSALNLLAFKYSDPFARLTLIGAQSVLAVSSLRLLKAWDSDQERERFHECHRVQIFVASHLVLSGYLGTWLHEMGHAFAMRTCLQNVMPETRVIWFREGRTYPIGAGAPTWLGERLGEKKGLMFIAAGGVISSTCCAMVAVVAARCFRLSQLSDGLHSVAFWLIFREVAHAVVNGSDFIEIRRQGGPNRLTWMIVMVALPIIAGKITSLFFPSNRRFLQA